MAVQDWKRFGVLAAYRRCAVCGCPLRANGLLYRPAGDTDRRNAQLAGGNIRDDGPTHLECSLFSVMICPFFATPQAKHSETGLSRGRIAAVLGFESCQISKSISDTGKVTRVEFLYENLVDPIVFRDPKELPDRLASAVEQGSPIDVDDRLYWRSDAELARAWGDVQKLWASA